MKYQILKFAVVAALGAWANSSMADWTNLPTTGVSVSGGTSPYILCNPTGKFGTGSGVNAPVKPSSTSDACAVVPSTETTVPDSSYTGLNAIAVASATRTVTINSVNVGEVREYIWRKPVTGGYQCIYAMKVNLFNADYLPSTAGNQYFEVNDIARRGFSGKTLDIAYSTKPTVAEPTYRVGRTPTSVQYRDSTGYVAQPLTGLGSYPAINGINTISGTPTAAQQQADVDSDWVDFTTDANYLDDDGSTAASSGMFYVRTSCNSGSFTTATDAIRLRQTFQELSGDGVTPNSFTEISVTGYLPN